MGTPEASIPKKKLKKWQIVAIVIIALMVIGQLTRGNSGSTSSSSTSSGSTSSSSTSQKADSGTHMACEHWRINLSNASVETLDQQIAGAQKVNYYASVSSNPVIVSNARLMTEAYIKQDSAAYLTYATAFGNACTAAGE